MQWSWNESRHPEALCALAGLAGALLGDVALAIGWGRLVGWVLLVEGGAQLLLAAAVARRGPHLAQFAGLLHAAVTLTVAYSVGPILAAARCGLAWALWSAGRDAPTPRSAPVRPKRSPRSSDRLVAQVVGAGASRGGSSVRRSRGRHCYLCGETYSLRTLRCTSCQVQLFDS